MTQKLFVRGTVEVVILVNDAVDDDATVNLLAWHSSHGRSEKPHQDQEDEMKKIHLVCCWNNSVSVNTRGRRRKVGQGNSMDPWARTLCVSLLTFCCEMGDGVTLFK